MLGRGIFTETLKLMASQVVDEEKKSTTMHPSEGYHSYIPFYSSFLKRYSLFMKILVMLKKTKKQLANLYLKN